MCWLITAHSGVRKYRSFMAPAKDIYQIAAVRVRNDEMVETFQRLIRPWRDSAWKKTLAKMEQVDVESVASADDVDLVMQQFFAFVQDDVLLSTQALGKFRAS